MQSWSKIKGKEAQQELQAFSALGDYGKRYLATKQV